MEIENCQRCGAENSAQSKFCSECGASLQTASSEARPPAFSPEQESVPPTLPKIEQQEEVTHIEPQRPVNYAPANQQGAAAVPLKKRRSTGGRILRTLIVVVILLGGGWLAFEKFAPPEIRRAFYESTGMGNSSFVTENAMASYIDVVDVFERQKLLENAWIVVGSLRNRHSTKSISTLELEFVFTDGSEFQTFSKSVNPEAFAASVFRRKIPGHKGGSFLRVRVVDAW
jgi:hypothetical protein